MAHHSLFGGVFEKFRHVEDPKAFNVDWSALFVNAVVAVRVDLLDRFQLVELKVCNNCVNVVFFAPIHKVGEHELDVG